MSDLPTRLRQLAKEMTEGDPQTAAMLILAAKALGAPRPEERESTLEDAAKACEGQKLGRNRLYDTDAETVAYNHACADCADAVRALPSPQAPKEKP